MIVPYTRTPISLAALPGILDAGYHAMAGQCPGWDVVAIAWAHLVLEHGRTKRGDVEVLWAVWCNNLGNHDATAEERADPSVPIFATVPECEGPTCSVHAVHRRRAYESVEEGARAYWETLRDQYPAAFWGLTQGADAFVAGLQAGRYFTGDATVYRRSVIILTAEAKRIIAATQAA